MLQLISENKISLQWIRSKHNMDQQSHPWITKVEGKAQHQRSLIKTVIKTPCRKSYQNNAVPQWKHHCSLNDINGPLQSYRSEVKTGEALFQEIKRHTT